MNNLLEYYFNSAALHVYKPDFGNASTLIFLGILNKNFFTKKDFDFFWFTLFFLFCCRTIYTSTLQLCNSKLFSMIWTCTRQTIYPCINNQSIKPALFIPMFPSLTLCSPLILEFNPFIREPVHAPLLTIKLFN